MINWAELRLIAITDAARIGPEQTLEKVRELCALCRPGGVAVQLRDHSLSARERLTLGLSLRALTKEAGHALLVNDRLDLAILLNAEGIHLGEASLPIATVRHALAAHVGGGSRRPGYLARQVSRYDCERTLPEGALPDLTLPQGARREALPYAELSMQPRMWVSCAAHDVDSRDLEHEQPDAWLLSPILEERKGRPRLGLGALSVVREKLESSATSPEARVRLFALGGVDAQTAADCLSAGADGVAVMGAVWDRDPGALVEALAIAR